MWRSLFISLGIALGKAALQWAIELDRQDVIIGQLRQWLADVEDNATRKQ